MNNLPSRPIIIYASNGEPGALLVYPYIYNIQGEWVGWITPDREVYSLLGVYVGKLTNDPRIVRRRTMDETFPRRNIPENPPKLNPPATIPLAPLMSELPYELVDVLQDFPDELHTGDAGELREDMD